MVIIGRFEGILLMYFEKGFNGFPLLRYVESNNGPIIRARNRYAPKE